MIVLLFLTTRAGAVDKLQADLIPQGLRARSEASIPVEVRFKWTGTRILEGRLEIELREGNRILERYRSSELALTTGEQTFRILLPPPARPFSDPQVEAHLHFVTAHQTYDLDYSILTMPISTERSFVVGWCSPRNGSDAQAQGLEQSLQFERYAPLADDESRRLPMTSLVRLAPEDLPLQPLSYTAFDVVVLNAEAFAEAREGQLNALARWVKGGGSVCVFASGGLRSQQLSFLNELIGSSSNQPAFAADNSGNLLPGHDKIACLHSGLGRTVIVAGNGVEVSAAWRQAVAFLWKFRSNQAQAIAETGHWEAEKIIENENGQPIQQSSSVQNQFRVRNGQWPYQKTYAVSSEQQVSVSGRVMSQLMPRNVRLIPVGALVGVLGLFLLMIGPADYFVLGWLGRRRLTWALFPATSIAFTVVTVIMANYYLGRHDQRRSLIVVDLDKDGTALRWNRYELIFAAHDRQAETELKDALWVPLSSTGIYPVYNRGNTYRRSEPPSYDGIVPSDFRANETIPQWEPRLNRVFSFGPPPVPMLSNWRAVEESWPNLPEMRTKLSQSKPFAGDLYVVSATNMLPIERSTGELLPRSIVEELCFGDSSGLFSLVSQVSPTGGGNFEDVQAMDIPGGDSILAIVTRAGDDIIVYRRFFHGN